MGNYDEAAMLRHGMLYCVLAGLLAAGLRRVREETANMGHGAWAQFRLLEATIPGNTLSCSLRTDHGLNLDRVTAQYGFRT